MTRDAWYVVAEDPDRLVKKIGRRIAELRRSRVMTQADFAEKLGASVQWVSRVERGENLTVHSLARLARVLGVRVVALFDDPGPEAPKVKRGRPKKAT